jgi:hypothetical protein
MLQKYLFTESELTTTKEIIFNASPLGQLRKVLPLEKLSLQLPLKKHPQGAMAWFDRQGMLALLFLKAYIGLSDASLIEHLNGNWQMQLFCGILLPDHQQIADQTLVSRIRSKVAKHLDLSVFQRELSVCRMLRYTKAISNILQKPNYYGIAASSTMIFISRYAGPST